MKFIFILLFFTTIVTNELVSGRIVFQDNTTFLCENPEESQTEKENKDLVENESESDYYTGTQLFSHFTGSSINATIRHYSSISQVPFLEIHSPPPE